MDLADPSGSTATWRTVRQKVRQSFLPRGQSPPVFAADFFPPRILFAANKLSASGVVEDKVRHSPSKSAADRDRVRVMVRVRIRVCLRIKVRELRLGFGLGLGLGLGLELS